MTELLLLFFPDGPVVPEQEIDETSDGSDTDREVLFVLIGKLSIIAYHGQPMEGLNHFQCVSPIEIPVRDGYIGRACRKPSSNPASIVDDSRYVTIHHNTLYIVSYPLYQRP